MSRNSYIGKTLYRSLWQTTTHTRKILYNAHTRIHSYTRVYLVRVYEHWYVFMNMWSLHQIHWMPGFSQSWSLRPHNWLAPWLKMCNIASWPPGQADATVGRTADWLSPLPDELAAGVLQDIWCTGCPRDVLSLAVHIPTTLQPRAQERVRPQIPQAVPDH